MCSSAVYVHPVLNLLPIGHDLFFYKLCCPEFTYFAILEISAAVFVCLFFKDLTWSYVFKK